MAVVLSTLWSVAALRQKPREGRELKVTWPGPAGWRCARTHAWALFHGAERKVWSDAAEEWLPGLYLTFWLQTRDLQHSSNHRLKRRPAASRAVKVPHWMINGPAGAGRGSEGSECKQWDEPMEGSDLPPAGRMTSAKVDIYYIIYITMLLIIFILLDCSIYN